MGAERDEDAAKDRAAREGPCEMLLGSLTACWDTTRGGDASDDAAASALCAVCPEVVVRGSSIPIGIDDETGPTRPAECIPELAAQKCFCACDGVQIRGSSLVSENENDRCRRRLLGSSLQTHHAGRIGDSDDVIV